VSSGILGLMDAIDKYDLERDTRFETYAVTRIRVAILDELRALDWIPRSTRQKARKLENVYIELENSLGRAATTEEVAKKIRAHGGETIFVKVDVSKSADAQKMVKTAVDTYGKLDILFNNAGIGQLDWLENMDSFNIQLTAQNTV